MPLMDLVTLGETMALVRVASDKPLESSVACQLAIGGSESNLAIGLARFGHRVRWISAVGVDAFGELIQRVLVSEGVDVQVAVDSTRPTGLMVKTPSKSADRFVAYYRAGSAASALDENFLGTELFEGAQIAHLTGITPALSNTNRNLVLKLAKQIKNIPQILSFDVNYRAALWSPAQASLVFRELAAMADLVFGSREELGMLVDDPDDSDEVLLLQVAQLGPTEVVMKLGEQGAKALVDGEYYTQPAFPVAVIDTVGAGDSFVAGYLSGWIERQDVQERLIRATFCGAMACTNLGDWEGAPSRQQYAEAKEKGVIR